MIRAVDREKKHPKPPAFATPGSEAATPRNAEREALYRKLQPGMLGPRPGQDAIAAAMEAVQRLAAEADAEDAASGISQAGGEGRLCPACGHHNREGNKFCSMCGLSVESAEAESAYLPDEEVLPSDPRALLRSAYGGDEPAPRHTARPAPGAAETHHYHHHYHHHYFPGGNEGGAAASRFSAETGRDPERPRGSPVLRVESMTRAEAAVRRITQEWVLACNTKHLDDLLDLYIADALVLRSNYPPVRGAAAIREFFFGALDAGLGEVEVDPIRVEVVGDAAYEAGRCKALVPGATGKRREERGKYLWVFTRQGNGEWKLASDCWSSDLTLGVGETDIVPAAGAKVGPPRKSV